MATRQNFNVIGQSARVAPSIRPGQVSFQAPEAGFVRAATDNFDSLSRAVAFFVRDAQSSADGLFSSALQQERKNTAEFEKKAAQQGVVDAQKDGEMDPAQAQFVAYADAFKTVKGANTGDEAFGRFLQEAAPNVPQDADPVEFARKWAQDNAFTIGDPTFDAKALTQFGNAAERWALNQRAQRVRTAQAENIAEFNKHLGSMVQSLSLTPEALQGAYAQARALMPHDPTNAAKLVISGLVHAARTPDQQAAVLARLAEPGSFAPGKSYAEQFPQVFAGYEEAFTRQRREGSKWREAEDYDALDATAESVLLKAEQTGDWTALPDVVGQWDKLRDIHGDSSRSAATRRKLAAAIDKAAKQQATFNQIGLAITDPTSRTSDVRAAWSKHGDAFMASRGLDPMSSAPLEGPGIPSSMLAAQAVAAFGEIPKETKKILASAFANGEDPDLQAGAYRFFRLLEKSRGTAFTLTVMPEFARPLYQAASTAVGDSGDVVSWFRNFGSPNTKEEDNIVTLKRITGKSTPADATTAAETALSRALVTHLSEGRMFNQSVTLAPDVATAMMGDLKVGATIGLRTGNTSLDGQARATAERVGPLVQIIPGRNGTAIATMAGDMPDQIQTPDGPARPVRLGFAVYNPATGETEDTAAIAEKDLSSLADGLSNVVGKRSALSLYVPAQSSSMGMIYRSRGVLPVLASDMPVVFDAGKPIDAAVVGGPNKGIVLSDDPKTAQDQFAAAYPSLKFALLPFTQVDQTTGATKTTYQLVYRPRFAEQGMTLDQREQAAPAARHGAVTNRDTGRSQQDIDPTLPSLIDPEAERRFRDRPYRRQTP